MTYDNRFPNMVPLFDGRRVTALDEWQEKRVRGFAKQIAARTNTVPFYNMQTGAIFLSLSHTPEIGPWAVPPSMWDRPGDLSGVIDDCVHLVNMRNMSASRKAMILRSNEQKMKWRKQDDMSALFEERRPDALAYAERLDRQRRGVQSVSVTL